MPCLQALSTRGCNNGIKFKKGAYWGSNSTKILKKVITSYKGELWRILKNSAWAYSINGFKEGSVNSKSVLTKYKLLKYRALRFWAWAQLLWNWPLRKCCYVLPSLTSFLSCCILIKFCSSSSAVNLNKMLKVKVIQLFTRPDIKYASWSSSPNPEDQINRKPDDRINK